MAHASLSIKTAGLAPVLLGLQSELFDLGAELAIAPDRAGSRPAARLRMVTKAQIQAIEAMIDRYEIELEPLKSFILPGGCLCAANLHLARTVARRAERRIITLAAHAPVSNDLTVYMNRLSDLLFVLARTANRLEQLQDVLWRAKEE
jgi:cob(I)alamin adenosyltransferase